MFTHSVTCKKIYILSIPKPSRLPYTTSPTGIPTPTNPPISYGLKQPTFSKPKKRPVIIKVLHLIKPDTDIHNPFPTYYRIFLKGSKFCISYLPRIPQPWHTNPMGLSKTWFINPPQSNPNWLQDDQIPDGKKRLETHTYSTFAAWLLPILGYDKSTKALHDLMMAEPTPKN